MQYVSNSVLATSVWNVDVATGSRTTAAGLPTLSIRQMQAGAVLTIWRKFRFGRGSSNLRYYSHEAKRLLNSIAICQHMQLRPCNTSSAIEWQGAMRDLANGTVGNPQRFLPGKSRIRFKETISRDVPLPGENLY